MMSNTTWTAAEDSNRHQQLTWHCCTFDDTSPERLSQNTEPLVRLQRSSSVSDVERSDLRNGLASSMQHTWVHTVLVSEKGM
jgi:hypothetical protein